MQTTTTTKPVVREGMRTPWGDADFVQVIAPGIGWVGTPGHGGVKLSRAMNARMPVYMRLKGGWYEEDCEWALVYVALAGLLRSTENDETDRLVAQAVTTLRNWRPDAYESFFGETIPEGRSTIKDERTFKARHANDWIVRSAVNSRTHDGFVEATATVGGLRTTSADLRTFLVPSAEYGARNRFGFVIDDPARYGELS